MKNSIKKCKVCKGTGIQNKVSKVHNNINNQCLSCRGTGVSLFDDDYENAKLVDDVLEGEDVLDEE